MQRVTKPIVLGVAALFGVGLITAAAADTHGDAVRKAVVMAKTLVGEARGDAVSLVASANGEARSDAAKADAIADEAAREAAKSKHKHPANHGATVSAVARDDSLTATVNGVTNHGFAVRAVAR
jgi:vacuolar-type H+-ATPase subunit H